MMDDETMDSSFRERLQNLSRRPSGMVWEGVSQRLHQEQQAVSAWNRFLDLPARHPRQFRMGVAAAVALLLMGLAGIYFGLAESHVVSGYAYTGETRLCRGTAYLFRVLDRMPPRDSVVHYRSAVINAQGFYRFPGIEPGAYLLRIAPADNTDEAEKYIPSWYVQHDKADSAHLVRVTDHDIDASVHLITRAY